MASHRGTTFATVNLNKKNNTYPKEWMIKDFSWASKILIQPREKKKTSKTTKTTIFSYLRPKRANLFWDFASKFKKKKKKSKFSKYFFTFKQIFVQILFCQFFLFHKKKCEQRMTVPLYMKFRYSPKLPSALACVHF